MDIDYLIIGQGLAGSLLAWELINRGQKVVIVDNGQENASLIAAGLINPITGMRFVKTKQIEQLLPAALDYYQNLSNYFQQPFYIQKPLLRILANEKEQLACKKRQQQTDYSPYLSQNISTNHSIVCPYGVIAQKQTGYLQTKPLLKALKGYFIDHQILIKSDIHYSEIHLSRQLKWQNLQPKNIIFCEGYQAINNPWFSWLPFQVVKGEIMTATANQPILQNIVNYGHWFIPLNTHQFRIGATFNREQLNLQTTLEAKTTLLQSLAQVYPTISTPHNIKQYAGIRPTTQDKMPFIGHHMRHSNLLIFNGFGAKGSLQIPWYCQHFADHLLHNTTLSSHCNINRHKKLAQ